METALVRVLRDDAEELVAGFLVEKDVLRKLAQLESLGIAPRQVLVGALRRARNESVTSKCKPVGQRLSASLHSLAVTSGAVVALGYQPCGPAVRVDGVLECQEKIVSVAAGWGFSLALTETGQVLAAGLDADATPCVTSSSQGGPLRAMRRLPAMRLVAAGAAHALAIDDDGRAWSWGCGNDGRLGRSGGSAPQRVDLEAACSRVAAGACHSLFVCSDGRVLACGLGSSGRLGLGDDNDRATPTLVPLEGRATEAAAGKYHSLVVLDEGGVYAWGDNSYGQLGLGDDTDRWAPCRVVDLPDDEPPSKVAAGAAHSLVLFPSGTVFGFGNNHHCQLGDMNDDGSDSDDEWWEPACVDDLSTPTTVDIAAGSDAVNDDGHSLALTSTGTLLAIGSGHFGQTGFSYSTATTSGELRNEILLATIVAK